MSTTTALTAMTKTVIAIEFIVPTVLAIALVIVLSTSAIFLSDKYLGPINQAEARYSVAGSH
jgi:hypothetical protein